MQIKPTLTSTTVGIYFDTRRATQQNKYPVKIRVIFKSNGKFIQRYFPTGVHLTRNEYEKVTHDKARNDRRYFRPKDRSVH